MDGTTVFSIDGTANTLVGSHAGANNTASGNTFIGSRAGYSNSLGFGNVFVGDSTGHASTQGFYNVFVGNTAGLSNSLGQDNTFVGARAGHDNDQGNWNTFIGSAAGYNTEDASSNTFVGSSAGAGIVDGSDNTYVGVGAGGSTVSGGMNTCIGAYAGPSADASGNVFIGYMAGLNEPGSDKLIVANGPLADDVLIYGDFSTGRLGLGTSSPRSGVHISSPTSNFGMLTLENAYPGDNEASIGFRPGSDATGADTWVAGVGAWGETGDFVIGIAEPKMVLSEDGRLGLGVTQPHNALEIEKSSTCWITADADGGIGIAGLGLENDTASWEIDLRGDLSDILAFMKLGGMNPETYLAIATDGDVGIGTTAPERKLHIKGSNPRVLIESSSLGAEVNFKHSGDALSDVWAIYKDGSTEDLRFYQGADKIWIKGGTGNVGIGGGPGSNRFYVNGTACGTSAWSVCSDLRLKRDIQEVGEAIDKLMSLRGVSFLWRTEECEDKDFDGGRHYGVIAQEVEEVLPEVVSEGADGEKTVAYSEIIPVLIEAIKTQQERIEILEERIAGLESGGTTGGN
jgi:hypothetical protein